MEAPDPISVSTLLDWGYKAFIGIGAVVVGVWLNTLREALASKCTAAQLEQAREEMEAQHALDRQYEKERHEAWVAETNRRFNEQMRVIERVQDQQSELNDAGITRLDAVYQRINDLADRLPPPVRR
jgi:biopolymer transport protein ExbB/TolQ